MEFMKNIATLRVLGLAVVLALLIGLLPAAAMAASPTPPMRIYGQVLTQAGSPAPDGLLVVAKVGTVEKASCVTRDGQYGIAAGGFLDVYASPGDSVHIIIAGQQVTDTPIPWEVGTIVRVDFSVIIDYDDTQPPTQPTLLLPDDDLYTPDESITFEWSESTDDNLIVHYTLAVSRSEDFSTHVIYETDIYATEFTAPLEHGRYYWRVRAVDFKSNASLYTPRRTFAVDTQAPTITLTAVTPDPTSTNTLTLSGSANGTGSPLTSVQYRIVGVTDWTAATPVDGAFNQEVEQYRFVLTALADGAYSVEVRATDTVGHVTATFAQDSFTVDTNEPMVVLNPLVPDPTTDTTPSFTGTAMDADGTGVVSVEYRLLGSDGTTVLRTWQAAAPVDGAFDSNLEEFSFTLAALTDGRYTVEVRATDAAGNVTPVAAYDSDTFVVDTAPPVITGVAATGVGVSTAYIYWQTNEPATSQVEYGTASAAHGAYESITAVDAGFVLSRSIPLSGLQMDTVYYYRVISVDAAGHATVSSESSFKTEGDSTPPAISDVSAEDIAETSAVIWWNTDEPSTSLVEYGTTSGSYTHATALYPSLVMIHRVSLAGLTPATTYYYRVKSVDGNSNEAISAESSFTTSADETAPAISGVTVDTIRERSAVARWSTNEGATSRVVYSIASHVTDPGWTNVSEVVAAYGSSTTATTAYPMVHGVSISGLLPGTAYYYRVISADQYGNARWSAEYQFTTNPDATAPVISGVTVPTVTETTAIVRWITNEVATSQVAYGTSSHSGTFGSAAEVRAAYDLVTAETTTFVLAHGVTLVGMAPGTTYYYRVISTDTSGNAAWSAEGSFTTSADATAPVISGVAAPAGTITERSAIVWWNTDEPATSQVAYSTTTHAGQMYANVTVMLDAYDWKTTENTLLVRMRGVSITGLLPGTTYYYRVISKDAAGNASYSDESSFTTSADITAPMISGINVPATTITDVRAIVWWNTNEPATSQVVYSRTSQSGTSFGSDAAAARAAYGSYTAENSSYLMTRAVSVNGLAPSTTYYFRVISRDAAGNVAISAEQSFVTKADTTPPAIIGVTVTHITSTSAVINWFTSEPATSHLGYDGVTRAAFEDYAYGPPSANPNLVLKHSALITGLSADTTYFFRVRSQDAAGNPAPSSESSFTTAADTTPPVITSVVNSNVGATMAIIQWLTNEPATSQIAYSTTSHPDAVGSWGSIANITATYGSTSPESTGLTTSHGIALDGLATDQTYYYRVLSKDGSGNEAWSEEYSFRTVDDTAPALDWGPEIVYVDAYLAVIVWTTDESSTTEVVFGTVSHAANTYGSEATDITAVRDDYDEPSGEDSSSLLSHGVVLDTLNSDTVYYYRVISKDASGNVLISEEYTFTTAS